MVSKIDFDRALQAYIEARNDVFRQERVIEELERGGHPTVGARTLLRLMKDHLTRQQQILERLQSQNTG